MPAAFGLIILTCFITMGSAIGGTTGGTTGGTIGSTKSGKVWAEERRESFSRNSPNWLSAVGRLQVPSQKFAQGHASHYTENCSATLVPGKPGEASNTIITAWHCLEFYSDLSRSIRFSLPASVQPERQYKARVLASGGGMHSDWALLRLNHSVPASLSPGIELATGPLQEESAIYMAGYSRDAGVGNSGKNLTYDARCKVASNTARMAETNCQAHKGSSGGAVVSITAQGRPLLYGIISAGNGENLSRFIPVHLMRNALRTHLSGDY